MNKLFTILTDVAREGHFSYITNKPSEHMQGALKDLGFQVEEYMSRRELQRKLAELGVAYKDSDNRRTLSKLLLENTPKDGHNMTQAHSVKISWDRVSSSLVRSEASGLSGQELGEHMKSALDARAIQSSGLPKARDLNQIAEYMRRGYVADSRRQQNRR